MNKYIWLFLVSCAWCTFGSAMLPQNMSNSAHPVVAPKSQEWIENKILDLYDKVDAQRDDFEKLQREVMLSKQNVLLNARVGGMSPAVKSFVTRGERLLDYTEVALRRCIAISFALGLVVVYKKFFPTKKISAEDVRAFLAKAKITPAEVLGKR